MDNVTLSILTVHTPSFFGPQAQPTNQPTIPPYNPSILSTRAEAPSPYLCVDVHPPASLPLSHPLCACMHMYVSTAGKKKKTEIG